MEKNNHLKRVIMDPEIMAGKAIIKGTRIPVHIILRLLSEGITVEEILEDYPNLKKEDIFAAMEYASEVVKYVRAKARSVFTPRKFRACSELKPGVCTHFEISCGIKGEAVFPLLRSGKHASVSS